MTKEKWVIKVLSFSHLREVVNYSDLADTANRLNGQTHILGERLPGHMSLMETESLLGIDQNQFELDCECFVENQVLMPLSLEETMPPLKPLPPHQHNYVANEMLPEAYQALLQTGLFVRLREPEVSAGGQDPGQ